MKESAKIKETRACIIKQRYRIPKPLEDYLLVGSKPSVWETSHVQEQSFHRETQAR